VDNRAEVREFLTSRRAKLTPQRAGLPDFGGRRVPGLRRAEVATLAGLSVEHYAELERGARAGASASVLEALARALQLDDAERAHLLDLARAAEGTSGLMRPADVAVAILRTEAGRDPHDKGLHDLVGELSTRSEEFRRRWSAHDVRLHGAGSKHFHHQAVGDLTLAYESLDLVSEPGVNLTSYAAEPGSPTAEALALLASWAATDRTAGAT
jgi:transcriptional regulator with XRE-family HTH domain